MLIDHAYVAEKKKICATHMYIFNKTLNIDHTKLEDCIDENTLAVVFVHYSGNPTNID